MAAPAIEFRDVTKTYRKRLRGQEVPALIDVSFVVPEGEVCAFVGPNGAGKTTSINILMGFLYADWGQIRVFGYEPGDPRAKSRIGFVPENFAFYKHLSAEKLLRFHAKLAGVEESQTPGLIRDLLVKVRLNGHEKQKIGRYSRGMVQRIGIAQALLADPDLLVLDEPTSGLDPAGRREVRDLILALKSSGKTVFLSSHILSEVEQVCDQAIIIKQGRVARAGAMEELLSAGDLVEIVVDRLAGELEILLRECGATVESGTQGVRITVTTSRKREVVERLWSAGCDVISLHPLKGSLEDFYLRVVGSGEIV